MSSITAHIGDPCIFCGVAHDDVEIGPCPARQSRAMYADALRELRKCRRGDHFSLMRLEAQAILDELEACHYRLHMAIGHEE